VPILAVLAIALAGDSIPAIIPRPAQVTVRSGAFTLKAGTVIVTDRALRGLGERLADDLFPATGLRLAVRTVAPGSMPARPASRYAPTAPRARSTGSRRCASSSRPRSSGRPR